MRGHFAGINRKHTKGYVSFAGERPHKLKFLCSLLVSCSYNLFHITTTTTALSPSKEKCFLKTFNFMCA